MHPPKKEMLHIQKKQDIFRDLFTNLIAPVMLMGSSLINILPLNNKVLSPYEITQGDHVSTKRTGGRISYYEVTSAFNQKPLIRTFLLPHTGG